MKVLKRVVHTVILKDPFYSIFNGESGSVKYEDAVKTYAELPEEKKN